jgi:hypothetical protein
MISSDILPSLHYFVAVDGSEIAHNAYLQTTEGLMKGSDRLTICHVYDYSKAYLPFNLKPEAIKKNYEALTVQYGDRVLILF